MKIRTSVFATFLVSTAAFAQNCDCSSNLAWVKKTFEENDAGFSYAMEKKGEALYQAHTQRIASKAETVKTLEDCVPLLQEWLTFFRTGHHSIDLLETDATVLESDNIASAKKWTMHPIDVKAFKRDLAKKQTSDYEGIWQMDGYQIGIQKVGEKYIGSIIASQLATWKPGEVKLTFKAASAQQEAVLYLGNKSAFKTDKVQLIGNGLMQFGRFTLIRQYPQIEETPEMATYIRSVLAKKPYLEKRNPTTLYLRIPSFGDTEKRAIDSVLAANDQLIRSTENLIIDIRNGTGGSDSSYREILPYLYTNPIRTVGVEYKSTQLNNQRMLDFIHDPSYGFDESGKQWAQTSYDKLAQAIGTYVNLNTYKTNTTTLDSVYAYPKKVGIICNNRNGSTDEQFLLAAKQSRKVKLFGQPTFGVLDISNMYFVPSPCREFELGYALSRSMRLPDYPIDGIGIQPDFYLDADLPVHYWTSYVDERLNESSN